MGGSGGGFGFLRGVGGVGYGSSDGDAIRQQQTISSGASGGIRDGSGTGKSGRIERGKWKAARAAE